MGLGNILLHEGRLYTLNSAPGWRLKRQPVLVREGKEYRSWNPYTSKIAAYMLCGGAHKEFAESSSILYLGASYGTTVSHLHDVTPSARIYAVEFAREPFSSLRRLASSHPGIIPVFEDATHPERYQHIVEDPELIVQDISQRDPVGILLKQFDAFRSLRSAYLSVKAPSIDSTSDSRGVIENVASVLRDRFRLVEIVDISRYEKGHALAFCQV